MGVIWTSKTRTRQPQIYLGPLSSGVKGPIALVSFAGGSLGVDAVSNGNRITSTTTTFSKQPANVLGYPAVGLADSNAANSSTWSDTTKFNAAMSASGAGSMLVVLKSASAAGFGSGNIAPYQTSGVFGFSHYPFIDGNIYLGPLSNSTRWVSAFAPTSSIVVPHVEIVTAKSGEQRYYYDGKLGASASLAETPNINDMRIGGQGVVYLLALWDYILSPGQISEYTKNPWQLFAPEKRPLFFSTGGGANNTGTLAVTLDAATLTGVGGVARSGTLATTLDAATLTGVGNVTRSGTLAVTLDAATLSGTGAVTTSGTLAVTLDDVTLAGVGSVAVGTNRDGVLAVTLDAATLAGIGAVTRSGTLAVTLDAATLAGIGTAGQAVTGTLGVTLGNVTLAGIGAIPAAPSAGGGKTFGSNKKKKKQRKAIESEEWLKAEETAKQLLQDRFTKTTPEAKLEALATHIESLQPVIDALKALATDGVQEAVQETKTEELTEHQLVLNRFDALEKKIESVEELLIILMADL